MDPAKGLRFRGGKGGCLGEERVQMDSQLPCSLQGTFHTKNTRDRIFHILWIGKCSGLCIEERK